MRCKQINCRVFAIAVFVLPTIYLYNPAVGVRMAKTAGQNECQCAHRRGHIQSGTAAARRCTRKPGPRCRSSSSIARFVHLDRLATDIRGKSGKVINRAEIIRALIDGLIDSGMDITAAAL